MIFNHYRYPSLDLHGEYAITAYTIVHDFLLDNIKLKNEYVVLIHGKGTGKLKNEVLKILAKEPFVIEYNLDPINLGQTIVKLDLNYHKTKKRK